MADNFIVRSGVSLAPDVRKKVKMIADQYFVVTKKKITVTSGTRTPKSQATAMYNNIKNKGIGTLGNYAAKRRVAVAGIKKAYEDAVVLKKNKAKIIADMEVVIKKQVVQSVFISDHLIKGAVDITTNKMSIAEQKIFEKIAASIARTVINEGDHFHLSL